MDAPVFTVFGMLLIVSGFILSLIGRVQFYRWTIMEPIKSVMSGLWKYSRFPTYFADIVFWFGLYFINLGVRLSDWWMLVYPMMYFALLYCGMTFTDAELIERKQDYVEYCGKVNRFMFWPQKKKVEMTPYA